MEFAVSASARLLLGNHSVLTRFANGPLVGLSSDSHTMGIEHNPVRHRKHFFDQV